MALTFHPSLQSINQFADKEHEKHLNHLKSEDLRFIWLILIRKFIQELQSTPFETVELSDGEVKKDNIFSFHDSNKFKIENTIQIINDIFSMKLKDMHMLTLAHEFINSGIPQDQKIEIQEKGILMIPLLPNELKKFTLSSFEDYSEFNKSIRLLYSIISNAFQSKSTIFEEAEKLHLSLKNIADVTQPELLFPYARLMKRKFVFHGGPTNSGKTYNAIQRLKKAKPVGENGEGGLYCAPLRLLATEVYEQLNNEGIHCELKTGQLRHEMPFANHLSCTIEMVNTDVKYDVAVVDEIQMILDPSRGDAWTKTILGLQANEIHLCGGLEGLKAVQKLVQICGDELEVCTYDRITPLHISTSGLESYKNVEAGDCIVAFTVKDLFAIKRKLKLKVSTNAVSYMGDYQWMYE